ncbi:MAG: hypothetical protein Kow0077_13520 [Anaerolineae bacterium]
MLISDVPFEDLRVDALPADSEYLVEATIEHIGQLEYEFSGGDMAELRLYENLQLQRYTGSESLIWRFSVHPQALADLKLEMLGGTAILNLGALRLRGLELGMSDAEVTVDLPDRPAPISLGLEVRSGALTVQVPVGAQLEFSDLIVSGGNTRFVLGDEVDLVASPQVQGGTLILDVPEDAPVQVQIETRGEDARIIVPPDYATSADLIESPAFSRAGVVTQIILRARLDGGVLEIR